MSAAGASRGGGGGSEGVVCAASGTGTVGAAAAGQGVSGAAGSGGGAGSSAAPASGTGVQTVAALVRSLAAVLGAGALILPAALAPVPLGYSVVVGLGVALWCLLVGSVGGTTGGAVRFVRERLGERGARGVTGVYFAGFATGQAAVALTAGEFAAQMWGGAGAFPAAVAVLLTAAAWATYRPRPLSTTGRRLRLAAVLAAAGGWWAVGGAPDSPVGAWVLLPLLFGWVGVESSVPDLRHRAPFAGTLLGVTAAAALYTVLLRPPAPSAPLALLADLPTEPLALLSALILWIYCRTNLQATGARWHELTGRPAPQGSATATTLALGTLTLAHVMGGTTAVLLLLPGIATAAILVVVAYAAVSTSLKSTSLKSTSLKSASLKSASLKEKNHEHDHHRPLEGAPRPGR